MPLTVRVWADLDNKNAKDESFGISNVVIRNTHTTLPITANFDNPRDFEGWDCGKITTCGKFGNICGGYNIKTDGDAIQQTFLLPADATYWVTMDFIKIDSWFE